MKSVIYYFTSTGNSLKIARDLAKELGDDTELVFIPDVIGQEKIKTDAERVGIVYPVYMFGEPLIVADFNRKLKVPIGAYVFAVTNYAGMKGAALHQTKRDLEDAGIMLSAAFGMIMPNNYTPLGEAASDEKQEKIFSDESDRVKEIARAVIEKKRISPGGFLPLVGISSLVYKFCAPKVHACDKEFWLSEGCTSCGICEKVCPVDNIMMESGRPEWTHNCQSCMACLQWCPAEVIQCGKNTEGRKRYRHPEVKLADIIRKDKQEIQ